MPLFIKAGAIIPGEPKVQYAMQEDDEPLRIFGYPGADGSYELYEDEGESYQYDQPKMQARAKVIEKIRDVSQRHNRNH